MELTCIKKFKINPNAKKELKELVCEIQEGWKQNKSKRIKLNNEPDSVQKANAEQPNPMNGATMIIVSININSLKHKVVEIENLIEMKTPDILLYKRRGLNGTTKYLTSEDITKKTY